MSNEDQEQSKTPKMEDSDVMTVEFLRARLLSERAVSKSARQRADELAKRVSELEEQLQFVSLQRKKAEKATADILAILENSGITNLSEEYYDSHSDNDDTPTPRDFISSNGSMMNKESSKRVNEAEVCSGSEIESSSPSTGRSLSWKIVKDPQHSLEKKKYMESMRRRASFGSYSSSARRIGKSCRKIKRRSVEELQNEANETETFTKEASNCSNAEPVASRESSGYNTRSTPMENTGLDSSGETQNINANYYSEHERDENMESALQRQAQLIGRYEEEEKAQREWEEKFRENNNSGAQDSCDPGNHSDVTEERYEMQSRKLSSPGKESKPKSDDHAEIQKYPSDARVTEKSETSMTNPYLSEANNGNLIDARHGNTTAGEYSTPEFSFPMSGKIIEQDQQQKESSASRCQPCSPVATGYEGQGKLLHSSSGSHKLAIVPQETSSSNKLGSVLDALQQAKLSLNQQINRSTMVDKNKADLSKLLPIASPGLFRLPNDHQFLEASRSNHPGTSAQSTLANHIPHETPGFIRFSSTPPFESRIANRSNGFPTDPVACRPFSFDMTPSFPSSPLNLHGFNADQIPPSSIGPNYLNSYTSPVHASVKELYPFLPDITLRIPLNEATSRTFPVSDSQLPPVNTRLSPFDDHARPNIYR